MHFCAGWRDFWRTHLCLDAFEIVPSVQNYAYHAVLSNCSISELVSPVAFTGRLLLGFRSLLLGTQPKRWLSTELLSPCCSLSVPVNGQMPLKQVTVGFSHTIFLQWESVVCQQHVYTITPCPSGSSGLAHCRLPWPGTPLAHPCHAPPLRTRLNPLDTQFGLVQHSDQQAQTRPILFTHSNCPGHMLFMTLCSIMVSPSAVFHAC